MKTKKKAQSTWDSLNIGERSLLLYMNRVKAARLASIQSNVFGDRGTGTSPARNNLRRLVQQELVARVDRGQYAITHFGERAIPRNIERPIAELLEQSIEVVEQAQHEPTDAERVEAFLRLALKLIKQTGIHDRRGGERRSVERRGPDRRLRNGQRAPLPQEQELEA